MDEVTPFIHPAPLGRKPGQDRATGSLLHQEFQTSGADLSKPNSEMHKQGVPIP